MLVADLGTHFGEILRNVGLYYIYQSIYSASNIHAVMCFTIGPVLDVHRLLNGERNVG